MWIFLGYGATTKHICYFNSETSWTKISTHHVFNGAHFSLEKRPPGPQLLYSLGLSSPLIVESSLHIPNLELALWPLTVLAKPNPTPIQALHTFLCLVEFSPTTHTTL